MACIAVFPLFAAVAQKSVTQLPVDSSFAFGQEYFMYALPQTAFQIDVVVTETQEVKGIYSDYASQLLGLNSVITNNKTTYTLKSVNVTPVTLPDEDYVYAVELSPAQQKNHFLNKLYENQMEVKRGPLSSEYAISSQQIPDFYRYYSGLDYTEKENNYVETKIVDGVVRQVPASRVQKVTKTSEQKAQEAADMVDKIRKDRYALLTGEQEVSYQPDALNTMIRELNELEKNYIGLFAGFTVSNEIHYQVVVMPGKVNIVPAFSFTPEKGFSTSAAATGDTYYLSVFAQSDISPVRAFMEERAKGKKYTEPAGYRIRRPVMADVSLNHGLEVVHSVGACPIYQLGVIESLPAGNDDFDIVKFVVIY